MVSILNLQGCMGTETVEARSRLAYPRLADCLDAKSSVLRPCKISSPPFLALLFSLPSFLVGL